MHLEDKYQMCHLKHVRLQTHEVCTVIAENLHVISTSSAVTHPVNLQFCYTKSVLWLLQQARLCAVHTFCFLIQLNTWQLQSACYLYHPVCCCYSHVYEATFIVSTM